jgi:hypothetical protein
MINRVPYEILCPQVEAMYAKQFEDHELKAIEKHCMTIQALIEGSGWDVDSYMQRWFYGESN